MLARVNKLLPQYSVPAVIAIISSLPTNYNGKLDRQSVARLSLSQRDEIRPASNMSSGEKMTAGQGE